MKLVNFRIDKCIFHEIVPPSENQEFTTTNLAQACFNITTIIEEEIIKRIMAVMGSNTDDSIEFELDKEAKSDTFEKIKSLFESSDDDFTKSTGEIAEILAVVQGKNTKLVTGPLIILTGLVGKNDHRFSCIIKADFTEGLKEDEGNEIKKIEKIFLTPSKDFYKVALIIEKDPQLEPRCTNQNFSFFVYDKNVTTHSEGIAKYFYRDFLGLKLPESDALKTKNFFNEALNFINSTSDITPDLKVELTTHLYSYLQKPSQNTVNSNTFANTYFKDEERQKDFKKIMLSLGLQSFAKNLNMLGSKLKRRRIVFSTGFNLSLDAGYMEKSIVVTSNEEKKETTLVIQGLIEKD